MLLRGKNIDNQKFSPVKKVVEEMKTCVFQTG
jgi:hypothetical protein